MNLIHHRTTRRILGGLVAAAALALPAQASAAGAGIAFGTLAIVDGDGSSSITVTQVGESFVIADPAKSLDAAGTCANSGSPAQVVCPAAGVGTVTAFLGDGNDRFDSSAIALRTVVNGGEDDDEIVTGVGADKINGASGNDRIAARDGTVDDVDCGSGDDSGQVDADDALSSDCESAVERTPATTDDGDGDAPVNAPPAVSITTLAAIVLTPRGSFQIGVTCGADRGSCRGTIELIEVNGTIKARSAVSSARRRKAVRKQKAVVLGRGKFAVPAGTQKNVTVRLDRKGRQRIIRKKKKTKAKLVTTIRLPDGTKATTTKNVTITAAPRERRTSGRSRGGRKQAAR